MSLSHNHKKNSNYYAKQSFRVNPQFVFKSSPYVGWFRHAPSLSTSVGIPTKYQSEKSCPHVGWFRHAPPSLSHTTKKNKKNSITVQTINVVTTMKHPKELISGRLPGGNPLNDDDDDDSTEEPTATTIITSSTVSMAVTNLINCFETEHQLLLKSALPMEEIIDSLITNVFINPIVSSTTFLFKRFLQLLDTPTTDNNENTTTTTATSEDNTTNSATVLNNSMTPTDLSFDTIMTNPNTTRIDDEEVSLDTTRTAKDDEASLSSLASDCSSSTTTSQPPIVIETTPMNQYYHYCSISQMDITRMIKNANKHLDVTSILQLPTVTYGVDTLKLKELQPTTDALLSKQDEEEEGDDIGLGWSIISTPADDETKTEKVDVQETCVICLEPFEIGDRLRILPCNHLFHIGCIDKWLSGSSSFSNCVTSGCPTCKKTPSLLMVEDDDTIGNDLQSITIDDEEEDDSINLDGSVPSWAFANLGGSLVYDTTTTTT